MEHLQPGHCTTMDLLFLNSNNSNFRFCFCFRFRFLILSVYTRKPYNNTLNCEKRRFTGEQTPNNFIRWHFSHPPNTLVGPEFLCFVQVCSHLPALIFFRLVPPASKNNQWRISLSLSLSLFIFLSLFIYWSIYLACVLAPSLSHGSGWDRNRTISLPRSPPWSLPQHHITSPPPYHSPVVLPALLETLCPFSLLTSSAHVCLHHTPLVVQ